MVKMSRAEAGRLGGRAKASARKASASVRPQPSTSAPSVLQQLLGPSSVSLGPHASQSALVPRDDFLRESWLIKSTALQSWISSPVDAPSGGKPLDHTNNLQLVLGANAKKSAKEGNMDMLEVLKGYFYVTGPTPPSRGKWTCSKYLKGTSM